LISLLARTVSIGGDGNLVLWVALDNNVLVAINKLWKIDVPSKIHVFGWRLLLDRLPTRSALNHRGILLNSDGLPCIFYLSHVEDRGHLFFSCSFSKGIWEAFYNWLGKSFSTGVEGWNNYSRFGDLVKVKKGGGRVSHLICLATSWSILKLRNNVIFTSVLPDASILLNDIKYFAWLSSRYGRKKIRIGVQTLWVVSEAYYNFLFL
jgi:hypothetical protein